MTTRAWMTVAIIAALGAGGAGCANKDNKTNPYAKAAQRQKDDAEQDDFGTKQEPAVTATTHLAAGAVAESQGNTSGAMAQYQQAVTLDPTLADGWFKLATLQARAKQYDRAVASWQGYLKQAKNDPAGYANLGFTLDLAGRSHEAEEAYLRGIAINPKHPACRINYGLQLTKAGRIDDAKAQFGAVLAPAHVHYNIASVYEQQGKTDLARAEYGTALTLNPHFKEAKTRLAALPVSKPVATAAP